jgi:membrane-associated phospholipid phosphatase
MRLAWVPAALACALLAPTAAVGFEGGAGVGLDRLLVLPAPSVRAAPAPAWSPAGEVFAGHGALGLASPWDEPPPPRSWLRDWAPSLVLAAALATAEFAFDPPRDARWSDENGFDEGVRGALRGGSRGTRDRAALASDVLFGGMVFWLGADWYALRGEYGLSASVHRELPWLLGNNLATLTAKLGAGRARPFVAPCRSDPGYLANCDGGRSANTSFFSGHASNTAAIAGLICARHLHRVDPSAADRWSCGGAIAGSLATGLLRMTADMHYASDVLAGWASGALFGYVLPARAHYRRERDPLDPRTLTPLVGPHVYGLRYDIRF